MNGLAARHSEEADIITVRRVDLDTLDEHDVLIVGTQKFAQDILNQL